jgi:hypothetical protein
MKIIKASMLLLLILVSAAIVLASPVFATPNITASSGSRPVSPFFTPSIFASPAPNGMFTGAAPSARFGFPTHTFTVSCAASLSGYVNSFTHTQIRLTSALLGSATGCISTPPRSETIPQFTCTVTTRDPWLFHARAIDAFGSAVGSINLTSACTFVMNFGTASCRVTIASGQSISPVSYSPSMRRLGLSETGRTLIGTMVDNRGATRCAFVGSSAVSLVGTYTFNPDTPLEPPWTITSAS